MAEFDTVGSGCVVNDVPSDIGATRRSDVNAAFTAMIDVIPFHKTGISFGEIDAVICNVLNKIGGDDWSTATWTMSIELFATFFIYLISQTAVNYRNRFWVYIAALLFFFIP